MDRITLKTYKSGCITFMLLPLHFLKSMSGWGLQGVCWVAFMFFWKIQGRVMPFLRTIPPLSYINLQLVLYEIILVNRTVIFVHSVLLVLLRFQFLFSFWCSIFNLFDRRRRITLLDKILFFASFTRHEFLFLYNRCKIILRTE